METWLVIISLLLVIYIVKTNRLSGQVRIMRRDMDRFSPDRTRAAGQTEAGEAGSAEGSGDRGDSYDRVETRPADAGGRSVRRKKSRTRSEWETLIGTKLLNRTGAVALILGAGFFMKTAYDKDWFSPAVRVLAVALYGFVFLLIGSRLHKKGLAIFAQGMIGSGLALLYLSVYSSFNYYHLITQWTASFLMLMVTAIAFFYALRYRSLAMALLGWFGGTMTPLILGSGIADAWRLFTYLMIMTAGITAIVMINRQWIVLELLSLVSAFSYFFVWHHAHYSRERMTAALVFVSVIWILFFLSHLIAWIRRDEGRARLRQIDTSLNLALYFSALYVVIDPVYHRWMGLITLMLASVYLFTSLAVRKRVSADQKRILVQNHISTAVLIVFATAIQLDGYHTLAGWAAEALVLGWIARRNSLRYVFTMIWILFAVSYFKLLVVEFAFDQNLIKNYRDAGVLFVLNWRDAASLLLIASMAVSSFWMQRMQDVWSMRIKSHVEAGWSVLLLVFCTVDADIAITALAAGHVYSPEILGSSRWLVYAVIWISVSIPVTFLGLRYGYRSYLFCGYAAFISAAVPLMIHAMTPFHEILRFSPVLNIRTVCIGLYILGSFIHLSLSSRFADTYGKQAVMDWTIRIAILLMLFMLITGDVRDIFLKKIQVITQSGQDNAAGLMVQRYQNMKQLALSGGWLIYAVAVLCTGVIRKKQYLRIGAIVLIGLTILKVFIYDLSYLDTAYRFVLFLLLGIVLLGVSYFYQKYRHLFMPDW
ncbi:DUF2339 domain-containing protein [bacterium]|nr:DUF2339 domain-containing protein [bacterium]